MVEDRRKSREALAKIGDDAIGISLKSQAGEREATTKFNRDYQLKQMELGAQAEEKKKDRAANTYRLFKGFEHKEKMALSKPKKKVSESYFKFSESLRNLFNTGSKNGQYSLMRYPSLTEAFGQAPISEENLGAALSRYKSKLSESELEDFEDVVGERYPELVGGASMLPAKDSGATGFKAGDKRQKNGKWYQRDEKGVWNQVQP